MLDMLLKYRYINAKHDKNVMYAKHADDKFQ